MDVKLNINFKQFLDSIKLLPKNQLEKIKLEMLNITEKTDEEMENFRNLLLSGPVMDENQYQDYLERRNRYSVWDKE